MRLRRSILTAFCPLAAAGLLSLPAATAQSPAQTASTAAADRPWMNTSLTPDQRADLVIKAMTLDEKLDLVHGTGWGALKDGSPIAEGSNEGAGYVQGIPRLGIPGINMADSAVGVRLAARESRYATLLPSVLGAASSWDPEAAHLYGSVIGRELRDQGYNMSIGGGVDITREPRNGRNFEYAGEDPVLAGTMVGNVEKGVLDEKVMNDIKHYALNDQETGRTIVNAVLGKRAMRESDLLAFQIAIGIATPSAVMCSYNRVNGDYSCENDYLLNQVLKKDWDFKGFVVSDWMGTHSTVKAALAGLDNEEPGPNHPDDQEHDDNDAWFAAPLKAAVQNGQVPMSRLEDMDHRVLRSMFAAGVIDHPPFPRRVVDPFRGRDDAERIANESIVLLKNAEHLLPLDGGVKSIALIGSHADVGVLSGGGSAQVDAPGGNAADPQPGTMKWGEAVYFPSSPLKEIRRQAPHAAVEFNAGTDVAAAAALAKQSQVAIVFVNQPMIEGKDAKTLSLPDDQDALVEAVTAANPHTIVVLETGGPVTMPWADRVAGIVEAWYPGIGGAQSLANLLFGQVNPSGKLPVTFAKSDDQLPHPEVPGIGLKEKAVPGNPDHKELPRFDADYNTEGARVGYKWYESEHRTPLFPFGYGLSYTTYAYSNLKANAQERSVSFEVKNTGSVAGTEIAEVYAELPAKADEPFKRLVAWQRVALDPGESKTVTLKVDPLYLSIFNTDKNSFELLPGEYRILAGPSSAEPPLHATMTVAE
ncbi:beta-glucosidase family protein [Paracidobacterium acidisoli]|uniref:Glycosyl hydrolase n=1 Tax=Paracidobacterium acidisoli TaxID=2303751 RepID=A0A372ISI7_9BACT|nr:glycoside hydrolase family 3 C-terminal domain-containing protein [Paracidobacterium acidisoli]MBT9330802.1 glycoside hydrolase family 3 C-terminal domain-containing protein [Paracidobacterium acidisoli]